MPVRRDDRILMPTPFPLPQEDGFVWTNQRIRFCHYYISSNGSPKKAGLKAGYKKTNILSITSELLARKPIRQYIDLLQKELIEKIDVTSESILREIALIAFQNVKNFYHEDGTPKRIHEMTKEEAAAIDQYDEKAIYGNGNYRGNGKQKGKPKGYKVRLKCHSKMEALLMLGSHIGLSLDTKTKIHKGKIDVAHSKHEEQLLQWKDAVKNLDVDEINHLRRLFSKAATRSVEYMGSSDVTGQGSSPA